MDCERGFVKFDKSVSSFSVPLVEIDVIKWVL